MADHGRIYYKIFLSEVPRLLELEEEKPGTAGDLLLGVLKYAYAHKDDPEAPADHPAAPNSCVTIAARHAWQHLIETYQGQMKGYLGMTYGGYKAPPGKGRPKGSKNKPRENTGSEAAEDPEEPDPAPGPAADDIRITGRGPWMPSESEAKKVFWAAALSAGCGEAARTTVNTIASQVWARLNTHAGYLAPNGMGGIDESETKWLVEVLIPDCCDPAEATKNAHQAWELLDAWAKLEPPVDLDFRYLLEMFQDGDFFKNGINWLWRKNREKAYLFPLDLLADINRQELEDREAQEEQGEE